MLQTKKNWQDIFSHNLPLIEEQNLISQHGLSFSLIFFFGILINYISHYMLNSIEYYEIL
jgi:hypothetical protein